MTVSRRTQLIDIMDDAIRHQQPSRRDQIRKKVYERVEVREGPLDTPCHIWTGPTSGENGRGKCYPRMYLDGQTMAVHKVNWTNEHGIIPGRKTLDHLCRNRLCVNDKHLELVSNKENNIRRAKAQKEQRNGNTQDDLQGVGLPIRPNRRIEL